jgi:hypothetical protein
VTRVVKGLVDLAFLSIGLGVALFVPGCSLDDHKELLGVVVSVVVIPVAHGGIGVSVDAGTLVRVLSGGHIAPTDHSTLREVGVWIGTPKQEQQNETANESFHGAPSVDLAVKKTADGSNVALSKLVTNLQSSIQQFSEGIETFSRLGGGAIKDLDSSLEGGFTVSTAAPCNICPVGGAILEYVCPSHQASFRPPTYSPPPV